MVFSGVGSGCCHKVRFIKFKGVSIIVEESVHVNPFLPASPLTAAICFNYAEQSLDSSAFVASWMVAVEVENNVGVSFLTIDRYVKITRR